MTSTNEVIVIALKDFEIDGMNYVAGSKYALTHEVIANLLKDGIVELVDTEPATQPEVEAEPAPAPEVAPEETPVVPESPVETTPEETQVDPTNGQAVPAEETPAPTPEAEAPVETTDEPAPWAGNHTVGE